MGWASRENEKNEERPVLVVCPTTQVNNDFAAFASRTKKALEIMQKFIDATCELDENAPDLIQKMSPLVEELLFNFVVNYPTPDYLETDIETLGQVKILTK